MMKNIDLFKEALVIGGAYDGGVIPLEEISSTQAFMWLGIKDAQDSFTSSFAFLDNFKNVEKYRICRFKTSEWDIKVPSELIFLVPEAETAFWGIMYMMEIYHLIKNGKAND
jgi:hypothetical protein